MNYSSCSGGTNTPPPDETLRQVLGVHAAVEPACDRGTRAARRANESQRADAAAPEALWQLRHGAPLGAGRLPDRQVPLARVPPVAQHERHAGDTLEHVLHAQSRQRPARQ